MGGIFGSHSPNSEPTSISGTATTIAAEADLPNCPKKGFLQTDYDFCIDACQFVTNKSLTSCTSVCKFDLLGDEERGLTGSDESQLSKRVARYKANFTGKCI